MTSLRDFIVDFVRHDVWHSHEPTLHEKTTIKTRTDTYIKELEEYMRASTIRWGDEAMAAYDVAVTRMLRFLRNGETEATKP